MALTINPAVSRVRLSRWLGHVALFVLGVAIGALATYAVTRAAYLVVGKVSAAAWVAIAIPAIALAAARDLGVPAPVPYPARRQVPEWLRRMLPPGTTAFIYGGQLGTGFLTRFTYSTHTAFVVLLATQSSPVVVGTAVLAFALGKTIVVLSSLAGTSFPEFEQRILHRHRARGQRTLRLANSALTAAAAAVLIASL